MFKPQVTPEFYKDSYDSRKRWNSYWSQIEWVSWLKPETVLEVGIGHGLVSWYLKNIAGLKVVTVDIDSRLNPDHVCSITELSNFFGPKSFDVVLAAEVLEHLPFQDFETSLRAMNCVCQWGAVITIPHSSKYIRFLVETPFFRRIEKVITFGTKLSERPNIHYWEIGEKGFEKAKINKILSKYFRILYSQNIFENPYHRIYILKKLKRGA